MFKFHAVLIGIRRDGSVTGIVQATSGTFRADLGGPRAAGPLCSGQSHPSSQPRPLGLTIYC